MATATQDNASDLLILWDSEAETGTIILDDEKIIENPINESSDIITFDDGDIKNEEAEVKIDENLNLWETNTETLDFWSDIILEDDISETKTTNIPEITPESNEAVITEEPTLDTIEPVDLSDFASDILEVTETPESNEAVVTEESTLDTIESVDLSGFGNDVLEVTETPELNEAVIAEESTLEATESVDLWDFASDVVEVTEAPEINEAVVTEQAILDTNKISYDIFNLEQATETFVTQLEDRKGQISETIEWFESDIDDRNNQIKNLRDEISDDKKSIKDLDTENSEIDNKISLVSWKKQANNIKTSTSAKVHNVKRKQAA